MPDPSRAAPEFASVLLGPLSIPGIGLGAVMLWFSLGSSLLPRSAMMQGVFSALSFTFGYALAVLIWSATRCALDLFGVSVEVDAIPSIVR
jgi:uncharacterized membrane protein